MNGVIRGPGEDGFRATITVTVDPPRCRRILVVELDAYEPGAQELVASIEVEDAFSVDQTLHRHGWRRTGPWWLSGSGPTATVTPAPERPLTVRLRGERQGQGGAVDADTTTKDRADSEGQTRKTVADSWMTSTDIGVVAGQQPACLSLENH